MLVSLDFVGKCNVERQRSRLAIDFRADVNHLESLNHFGTIALSKASEEGRLDKGDRINLMGIGSGLNCYMAEVIW